MTELEKMLPPLEPEKTTPTEPEFESFSNWQTNNTSGDLIQDRVNWGNYVREQYVDANLYDDYVEKEIRDTTVQRLNELVETEQINREDLNKRLYEIDAESDTDLDSKLKSIQSTFDYKTAEWETASKYLTFKEYNPEGDEQDEVTRQRGEELFTAAQSVADRYYDDAKRRMALSGEIPIAKITGEDGKPEFIIGPSFNKDNLGDAIRNSKKGDVSFADAAGVVAMTRIPKGYNEETYKVKRYREAGSVIGTIWGSTSNSILDRYADKLAEADADGRELTENEQPDFAQIRKDVNKMLPENEGFSDEEVKKAFTQIAYMRANGGNKFKVYEDEEAYKNVRNVGFAGPLVNPLVMANEEKFLQSINANPQLTEEQRKDLTAQRTPFLQENFDHYNKNLTESDLSEKWLNALQAGRASGQKDYEILDAFSKDKTNFNEMSARLSGIGESIQDAFGELGAAIPMLFEADWARDYMIGNIKERSNRKEVARLFGTEFGTGQQFMETVAPMLVDIGATALLTGVTSPIGSAAYLSAKAGARLTAKGLLKGVATSAFRQLPNETAEQAAKRVLAAGLIKESTTEAGMTGAMKAIGAYNSSLASSIGTTSAMAIPAFNRSAGSTYASVYAQLQADGKLSPEEMHDRALGAGLTSGAITAAITSGFAALGRVGIEDALLGGATKRQLKNILSKISKVDDIADDEFDAVVSSVVSDSLKKFGAPNLSTQVLKNSFDEGAEEALDEFINGFVSDAATDQDTPFLQRLEQAGRAALIGAGMGAGVPAIKAVRDTIVRQGTADQRLAAQWQVSKDVSDKFSQRLADQLRVSKEVRDKLLETSPISAETVFTILTSPRSGRAEYARAKFAEARESMANAVYGPIELPEPVLPDQETATEGTTVKEQAGADENESSPAVLTPDGLVNAGKPAEVAPESGTVTPETTAPNQQAAPVTLNLKEEVESALANPVVINGNNVEFAEIPYKHKFAEDPDSPVTEQTGQARAVNMAGRPVVVAVINGVRVPFYQSTGKGGKADVAPKKWYPVFGVSDGWFNKTTGAQINNYYGSQELRDVAEYLDNNVGDVVGVNIQRTSYSDDTPQVVAINEGLAPTPNNTPETKQRLTDNINSVLERLTAARPAVQQQVAEQTVAAEQAAAEEEEANTPIAAKVPKPRKERVKKIKQALQDADPDEVKGVLKTIIKEEEAASEIADPPKVKQVPSPIEEDETVTSPDLPQIKITQDSKGRWGYKSSWFIPTEFGIKERGSEVPSSFDTEEEARYAAEQEAGKGKETSISNLKKLENSLRKRGNQNDISRADTIASVLEDYSSGKTAATFATTPKTAAPAVTTTAETTAPKKQPKAKAAKAVAQPQAPAPAAPAPATPAVTTTAATTTAPKKQPKAKAAKAVAEPQVPTETAPAAPAVTEKPSITTINWDLKGIGSVPNQVDLNYFGFERRMLPSDFRKIVPKGVSGPKTKSYILEKISVGEAIAPPFVRATWDDKRKVWVVDPQEHEGRSRTDAAAEIAPNETIPVSIFPNKGMRARSITDEMRVAPIVLIGKLNKIVVPAISTVPTTSVASNPKDTLNISGEEESNLNKNAVSGGLDPKKATKHVRKAMVKMGLLKPDTDVAPPKPEITQPEVPVEKKKPATLMGEALSEMIDTQLDFLVENGVVARIKKSSLYGLPSNHTDVIDSNELSNKLAQRVFERYKPLTPQEVSDLYQIPLALMNSARTPDRSWWNPFTKTYVQKERIQYRTVIDGGKKFGLFDNNPLTIAAMLRKSLPVYVPTTFSGEINKAIKVDSSTRTIYDVSYPDPFGGPQEVSIVYTEDSNKQKSEVAEIVSNQLELLSAFKPPLDSKIKVDRNLTNLADKTQVEDDPSITYYKALDRVDRFFGDVYSNIGDRTSDKERRKMVGPSKAFLKLMGFDDRKKGLSEAQIIEAKQLGMLEVVPEFHMTLFKGELYQTLEREEAINFDSTKSRNQYSIVESKADVSREALLSRIQVPTDFTIPKELEGKSDLIKKAYFLLDKGFKTGQTIPKINDDKITAGNLDDQSANIVVDQFIFNSINDSLSRPDNNGMFPDVAGIVERASNRVMDRIKFRDASAKNSDAFDRLRIDDDQSASSVDAYSKELAEVYGVEEATVDSIHSSLDALKAENVYRGVRSQVEKLLRTDSTVAGAMRSLAKNTVFKNDPSLADNMYPVQLFSEVALWASYNKQTSASSFRFRRQLLDHFPSASMASGLVHDAFEASGAFQFNFKRAADKNTINMLIRNGLSEQDAKFLLERRNIKRIVDETGVTEAEAESIMRSQLRAQTSYSAPSFIDAKHRQYYRQLNLAEIARLGLESGNEQSVVEALRKIAKNGRTEQNKAVAQLILRFQNILRDTKFNIVDIEYNKAGEFIRGENGTNRVLINTSGYYGNGVESVLLHEYIHAITHTVIARPDADLTPAQRGAKARLKGLLQLATKEYNDNLQKTGVGSVEFEAATVNLDEFIATFFSSVQFQNQLKVLRQTNQKARSFFARIYDAILDIFGIKKNSNLDNAFDALVDLVEVGNVKGRSSLAGFIDKSLMEARNNGARRRIVPVRRAESAAEIEARLSSFEGIYDGEDVTPEEQAAIDTLIDDAVQSLIPSNVDVTIFDTQKEADDNGIFGDRPDAAIIAVLMKDSTGRSIPTIFINRANMRSAMLARNSVIENPVMAKGILEAVLNEEMFHIAEFYALSKEEVAAVAGTMADVEFDDIVDQYTSNETRREQIKQALRGDNGAEVKYQLVGEMLRMRAQMITRGYTTEQDIAFFETNPSLMSLAFRYFRGFFRRMYARYNLNKNNPELAASIHLMSTELNFLRQGTYNPDTHASFDPNNPDANMEILRKRFSALSKDITAETTDDEIMERFKGMFATLELPVALFSRGEYKHMSTKMEQWMKGEVDPRVTRVYKQMVFFQQATDALGKSMMTRIEKLIKEAYGKNGIDPAILADATGTTENIYIDKDLKKKFRQEFTDAFKSRKERVINGELDPKWIDADHKAAMRKAMLNDRIEAETLKLRQEVRAKQAAALDKISKDSPQLAAALVEMRKMTDAMSKVIKDKYNLSEQLQIKFDNNMGIYLTRAYAAFNEEGYIEKVLESKDPKFVEIREEASTYFRETYIKRLTSIKYNDSIKKSKVTGGTPITKEQARELAVLEINSNPAIVAQFMAQFLRSYSPDYHRRAGVLPKGVTKSLINNLRRKGTLDPRVRKLLGEYEQETEGVNNLLRTYSLVSGMVARQSFYNNLIQMAEVRPVLDPNNNPVLDENGEPVQDGFLLTEDQLRERLKKNPMMQQEYVNLRTGRIYTPDSEDQVPAGLEGEYDPTYNYYGPKEMIEGMRRMYTPPMIDENLTGAQRATSAVVNAFNGITGISLATKTLGSLPFYLRNIVSNMFFFAPAQGFFRYGRMFKSLKLVTDKAKIGGTFDIDAYQAELIALGILNNEMTSSLVKDMLKGKFKVESVNEEINTILGKIKSAGAKGAEFIKPATDKLQALSAAVDGFYKMAYFEHELDILRKAKDADVKAGNRDSFFAKLTDDEMKQEAARKVLATAQSYSEAPPIVQEAVRSVGMFIAPFLRFKTEVPRIIFNTYKEGIAEIKSGNPVIAFRGKMRVGFMTGWLAGISAIVPSAIRMFFGIWEDEDEFLRSTVPSYLRDNTFFYYEPFFDKGKLKSADFTFLNPFSSVMDPVMRGLEHIFRGEPADATVAFTRSFLGTYLDEQIFTGALADFWKNRDADTGQPIYYDADGLQIFTKGLGYVVSKAFLPRALEKSWEAVKSTIGEAPETDQQLFGILAGELKPFKPHEIDIKKQLSRFLKQKRDERNDYSYRKNELKTPKTLTDIEIRGLARDFVESRIRIDEELYRGLRAVSKLPIIGLSEREIVAQMREKDVNMGPRRTMLLQNKLVEKPTLDPSFIQDVLALEGGVGQRRLQVFQQEIDRLFPTRFMPLNP